MSDQGEWSGWMLVGDLAQFLQVDEDRIRTAAKSDVALVDARYRIEKRHVVDLETGIETHALLFRCQDVGPPSPGADDFFARWRRAAGINQDALAKRMGISRPTLCNAIENGGALNQKIKTLRKWAHAVGIPRREMLAWLEWYIYNKEEEA